MAKRNRKSLTWSEQLRFYVGATIALIVLMLIGYWLEINLALPAFLVFLLVVTIAGARQERAERQAEETDEETTGGTNS